MVEVSDRIFSGKLLRECPESLFYVFPGKNHRGNINKHDCDFPVFAGGIEDFLVKPVGLPHSSFNQVPFDSLTEELPAHGKTGHNRCGLLAFRRHPDNFQRVDQERITCLEKPCNPGDPAKPFFLAERKFMFYHVYPAKKAGTSAGLSNIVGLNRLFKLVDVFNILFQGHGHGRRFGRGGFNVGHQAGFTYRLGGCRPETGNFRVVLLEVGEVGKQRFDS